MQLILDSETTIDIKRNMSTLNDSPLSEKLDVTHDLKSLCNGNKENIQSNDNTISSDEKADKENEKAGDNIVSESPMADDSNEKTLNMEVNDNDVENITPDTTQEENSSEDSSLKITEEYHPVIEDATKIIDKSHPSNETVTSSNEIKELNKKEMLEETGSLNIQQSVCENDNVSCNGKEYELTTEQKVVHKKAEHLEELAEVNENLEVSEKTQSAEITVAIEDVDCGTKIDKNEGTCETKKEDEKVVEEVNGKVHNDSEVTDADEKCVKSVEQVNKDSNELTKDINVTSDVKDSVESTKDINMTSDVKDKDSAELKKDSNVESDVKDKDSIELMKDDNMTSDIKEVPNDVNNDSDSVMKNDVEALVVSPTQHIEQNSSCGPQMSNEQTVIEKSQEDVPKDNNTLNIQPTSDEIETVNLDDEEKELESSQACSNIVNVGGELKTNNVSNSVSDENDKTATEMETVDLDDEQDVSEIEPMDVDRNGETGELETKEMSVSESSKTENVDLTLTLDCEDNHEGSLSTKEKTENIELNNSVTAMDEDTHPIESKSNDKSVVETTDEGKEKANSQHTNVANELKSIPSILKLSNTLDILSDDEDEVKESQKSDPQPQSKAVENDADKKCISIDDDDDIMLIDEEDTNIKDTQNKPVELEQQTSEMAPKVNNDTPDVKSPTKKFDEAEKIPKKESTEGEKVMQSEVEEKQNNVVKEDKNATDVKPVSPKPLIPNDFLKTCKKNMAEMTRDDLEEFCILKIVESVVDRSSLSEIMTKLKSMSQSIEEYKKKAMMLTKQNRDLQVVLKTIQEEQKNSKTVTPLKITRSVGMQVLMTDRSSIRRKPAGPATNVTNNTTPTKSPRPPNQRPVKVTAAPSPQQIPVPRLIPASNSPATKNNVQQITTNNTAKAASPVNGVRNNQPKAEKRSMPRNNNSVTVDLTDDEPPAKMNRNSTPTPVRVVPPHMVPQNLLNATPRHPIGQNNNPRKVYIPISGPQNPAVKQGQAIMLKSVTPSQNPRPRLSQPNMARLPQNQIRMSRVHSRHPAPLPESNKVYPGNYSKSLPPAPDLKLSKVENGIVISWKIEGYPEDSYEEIASYQLYAYQETNTPPSTSLWKKIGDVKALPLPMACTLTQFMAGFKYYFAVRAVDIRSRIGPFSLPGSILLLNKL